MKEKKINSNSVFDKKLIEKLKEMNDYNLKIIDLLIIIEEHSNILENVWSNEYTNNDFVNVFKKV